MTSLVAEAFRANGGIVGPKLVEWDDPGVLQSVGYSVDPYGFSFSISEPGELDQSQHDTSREVFAVSDACLLIRADLFETIGGFTDGIPYFGEDIDLCWRVHTAAATVHLYPPVVVRHRARFGERRVAEKQERLELRHEARTMLSNYELPRLLRVVPVVALLSLMDLLGSVVLGRFSRAGDIVASWLWNLWNLPSLFGARSRVRRTRRARDADYLPLMRQGSSRLSGLVRSDDGENRLQAAASAGRGYVQDLASGSSRYGAGLAIVAALLVVLGARDLFTGPIPAIREFVDAGTSASALLAQWWSGWREAGMGEAAVAPGVVPGLGALGTVLFGSIGLARRLLVLAPLFLGALGAWKLLVHTGSIRARAGMLAAYGLNPVVLNAVAEGRLQALWVYGAAPWILRRIAVGSGVEPFADPEAPRPPRLRQVAGVALGLGVVAAVTPLGALVLLLVVLLVGAVLALSGDRPGGGAMVVMGLGGAAMALPIMLPWLVAALSRGDAASLTGLWVGRGAVPAATELITGSVGPVEVGLFGWGLLVAAGYALAAGRSWRLRWALAGWALALVSWAVTVLLAADGMLAGAGAELFLVPAALGLALSVAMGALAFEHDVIGSDFGLPQVLSGVAVVALLLTLVPVGVAAVDGRWYQPEGGFGRVLELVDDGDNSRTVWIGDPDVLPISGWPLDAMAGLSVGTSIGVDPLVTQRYRLDGGEGIATLRAAIDAALRGQTSRLGRLLAPMGVQNVVVIDRPAPQPFAVREVPVPEGALAALREQLDLTEVELNPGLVLFQVDGPWPLRSDITELELPDRGDIALRDETQVALERPPAVFGTGTGTRFTAELDADRQIAQAETADEGWSLTVDGQPADRAPLFGWQQQWTTEGGGAAELMWSTPAIARVLQAVQLAALIALVLLLARRRRIVAPGSRRRRVGRAEPLVVLAPDGELLTPAPHGGDLGTASTGGDGDGDPDGDGHAGTGEMVLPEQPEVPEQPDVPAVVRRRGDRTGGAS